MNTITAAVDRKKAAKKRTMQEMNEQYKDCPVQVNEYEMDGRIYRVTSHFIGDRDINDVMYSYAVNRAMGEMLGHVPTAENQ